ncbi:hypothetical protein JAAARDRAFT_195803 [Jaapia argillacea MUCL 33604]|uniref:Uncharacterized protein n=1 Tax=Jaapia argillacea MUCL 33604 TaxID=933084 RepID=A0A067PKN4_9AGAM|nr:hypothetical protein JAAARDRAFT_195803 [Jaapia argillacea MUCL 33604]
MSHPDQTKQQVPLHQEADKTGEVLSIREESQQAETHPQQSTQPKLSRAEKRRLNDKREVQAASDLDDAALAAEGDPQALKEVQEALQSIPINNWYRIPLFVLATDMDVDMDPTPTTDEPRAPSWSPTRVDNVQSQSPVPQTPPRTRSPSPRPQSPMRVEPTSV